jgi:hypothetical protein
MRKETTEIPEDWRKFVELLNSNGIEYLIVGALALAYHGFPRYTGDFDVLIRNTPDNARRLESALASFGLGSLGLKAADFTRSYQVVQIGVRPYRIDILTSISGVSFEEAWASRVQGNLAGVPVSFIGREALTRNKRSSRRLKDRADLELLEKTNQTGGPGARARRGN